MKVREPIVTSTTINKIKNMDINSGMPNNKLIINCTDKELVYAYGKYSSVFDSCEELFGDIYNLLGNVFLQIRNAGKDGNTLYLLSMSMAAINIALNLQKQIDNKTNTEINWDEEYEKLLLARTAAKNETKKIGHYDLSVADKAYYNGQLEMLNKLSGQNRKLWGK